MISEIAGCRDPDSAVGYEMFRKQLPDESPLITKRDVRHSLSVRTHDEGGIVKPPYLIIQSEIAYNEYLESVIS